MAPFLPCGREGRTKRGQKGAIGLVCRTNIFFPVYRPLRKSLGPCQLSIVNVLKVSLVLVLGVPLSETFQKLYSSTSRQASLQKSITISVYLLRLPPTFTVGVRLHLLPIFGTRTTF